MRHQFLLDENILYHAIRGVDRHNKPDTTAALLILTIAKVCHSLVIHQQVLIRYTKILDNLKREPSSTLTPATFIRQLLSRLEKRAIQYDTLPSLPAGCQVPSEDEYLIRAALISHPLLVTADEPLYTAIKNHPELGIEVLWPREALERAKEKPKD